MYKLVVLDIDGTLLTPSRKITRKTKKVINKIIELGVIVVISTGRNKRLTTPIINKLKIDLMYACVGGTEIYGANHEVLFSANLKLKEIKNILDLLNDEDCFVQLTKDDGYYKYINSEVAKKYDAYESRSIKGKISNKYVGMQSVPNLDIFVNDDFHNSNEIIIGGPEETLIRIKDRIENNTVGIQVRNDLWDNYIFVGKENNSKASAIEWLCEYLDINVEEVIAIGDDVNDCDMLEKAGLGIAMGNASDIVKKSSNDITYTNKNNGVAYALEHYIIKGNKEKINYIG